MHDAALERDRRAERYPLFPDRLRGSVRNHAGQDRSCKCDRRRRQGGRGLRRLCDVVRHDAGRSRRAGDPGTGQPHPITVEAGSRLGHRRSGDGGKAGRAESAPGTQARDRAGHRVWIRAQDRRRVRIFFDHAGRAGDLGRRRPPGQALLRPAGAHAPLRRGGGDLRRDGDARLEALSERPRRRERPVRDELGVRHGAAHR